MDKKHIDHGQITSLLIWCESCRKSHEYNVEQLIEVSVKGDLLAQTRIFRLTEQLATLVSILTMGLALSGTKFNDLVGSQTYDDTDLNQLFGIGPPS